MECGAAPSLQTVWRGEDLFEEEGDQEDPSDVVDHTITITLKRKVSFNISIIKHLFILKILVETEEGWPQESLKV